MSSMKTSLNVFITTLLGLCLLAVDVQAASNNGHARFSIAISGGASKGAYEAGLNWSVIKIARDHSGYTEIKGGQFYPSEMASITGASAGGINTLLSGLSWCSRPEKDGGIYNDIDNNVFRDIWLRADINTLLPERADSPAYLPDDALLSRKDFINAARELIEKWNKPSFRSGCRIPLGVTVTSIEPDRLTVGKVEVQNQRFYIPFELRVANDNSIDFFFDPADYPKLADPAMILMPRSQDAPPFSIDDQRIEDVSFTTSAFPMAFGRKRLQYCKLVTQNNSEEKEQQSPVKVDTDLVCPDGYQLAEAVFADGGLFDNLPIGVARTLAESNVRMEKNPYPVTYMYIDPNRTRYKIPDPDIDLACDSEEPPAACRIMEFSAASESELLIGFLGTARRYELYRELTSDDWQLNLSEIGYRLADILRQREETLDCKEQLPYFSSSLDCADALDRAGQLLEIAYDRIEPVIDEPYSLGRLDKKGIIKNCRQLSNTVDSQSQTACTFNITRYRNQLADAMLSIMEEADLTKRKIYRDISQSRLAMHHDRALRVSSRGAPITGTLLQDFGSFLDYKFREYDYYVGVYDGVIMITRTLCSLQYASNYQSRDYRLCFDSVSNQLYTMTGLDTVPHGSYVFARLAQREFGEEDLLRYSYEPMPATDRDMQIIHDGLAKALAAGESEKVFFKHLKTEDFIPTAGKTEKIGLGILRYEDKPLMEQIIDDPDSWASELTRRATNRLVYLETQAANIYAAREPDKEKREKANTALMGATAFVLQSSTYKHHQFSFSPSTAPDNWFWRNLIPYELAFDLSEGDLMLTWQPTYALSKRDLLGIRGTLGFPGGLFQSSADTARENYLGVGIDYTRLSTSPYISSYGFTPTWYHAFNQPENFDRDTFGGDIHIGVLKDRMRIGVGTRNFDRASDAFFFTIGITDIPGMVYWLTR